MPPRGRPCIYATSEERRAARLACQAWSKKKKRLAIQTQSQAAEIPVQHSPKPTASPSLASFSFPLAEIIDTILPPSPPECVSLHAQVVCDKVTEVESRLCNLRSGLLEHQWGELQAQFTEMSIAEDEIPLRVSDLHDRTAQFGHLEKFAEECLAVVADFDPGFQHPLSHRLVVVTAAVGRSRRLLCEMHQAVDEGVFTEMRRERALLSQRVWGDVPPLEIGVYTSSQVTEGEERA